MSESPDFWTSQYDVNIRRFAEDRRQNPVVSFDEISEDERQTKLEEYTEQSTEISNDWSRILKVEATLTAQGKELKQQLASLSERFERDLHLNPLNSELDSYKSDWQTAACMLSDSVSDGSENMVSTHQDFVEYYRELGFLYDMALEQLSEKSNDLNIRITSLFRTRQEVVDDFQKKRDEFIKGLEAQRGHILKKCPVGFSVLPRSKYEYYFADPEAVDKPTVYHVPIERVHHITEPKFLENHPGYLHKPPLQFEEQLESVEVDLVY